MTRKAQKSKLRYVGTRMERDLYDEIAEIAKKEDRSVSYMMGVLLRSALQSRSTQKRSPQAAANSSVLRAPLKFS